MYSEAEKYKADFSFESGVPPDNDLGDFSGQRFSSYDQDNDQSGDVNCANKCGAGFWYNNCDENRGTVNQAEDSACGGFSWDKTDPNIVLKESNLYLTCQ